MNKKSFLKIALVFTIMMSSISIISAEVTTLFQLTDNTYATSEHADNYTADTYYGTVREDTITVKDKWNLSPEKTKVYGSYGRGFVSNLSPYTIDK